MVRARVKMAAGEPRRRPAPNHHATEPARPVVCRCGKAILKALDEGVLVRVEPAPICRVVESGRVIGIGTTTEHAERLAIGDGRRTYVMTMGGELWERTPLRIRSGSPIGKIYAEHMCPRGVR